MKFQHKYISLVIISYILPKIDNCAQIFTISQLHHLKDTEMKLRLNVFNLHSNNFPLILEKTQFRYRSSKCNFN